MKRLILVAIVTLAMTANAYAGWETGTIEEVKVTTWDGTTIKIKRSSDGTFASAKLNMTGDTLKTATAIALTAKSTGNTVRANWAPGGFNAIEIK